MSMCEPSAHFQLVTQRQRKILEISRVLNRGMRVLAEAAGVNGKADLMRGMREGEKEQENSQSM